MNRSPGCQEKNLDKGTGPLELAKDTKMNSSNTEGRMPWPEGTSQVTPADYLFRLDNTDSYRCLVENGADLVSIIDQNGNYLYVANNSKALLGYDSSYFNGKNAFAFIHPEDAPAMQDKLGSMGEEKVVDFPPFRFLAASGEWRWIESRLTNLLDNPAIHGMVINSRDITDKVELQEQLKEARAHKEREITRAVVFAQEKERQGIGAELHDNVNQLLASAKLYLDVMRTDATEINACIPKCTATIESAIDEIRKLSRKLVGPKHQGLGLEEALRELMASFAVNARVHYHYHSVDLSLCPITEETELVVYRIVQEQFTNISRHAHATEVDISLKGSPKELQVTITDNGQGFEVDGRKEGIGISNMRNRAHAAHGTLQVTSSPGHGCLLHGVFKVAGEPEDTKPARIVDIHSSQ